jgi:hypothetical protein
MRRLAVSVTLIAIAAGLSGCFLGIDGATDVTQTSAQLNAKGQTGDEPGWFQFQYARRERQLGTAKGRVTPERGPIPPNTPPPGALIAFFHETVTGLLPGRVYVFRVCGRQGAMTVSVCGEIRSLFTQPTDRQDWVAANFRDSPIFFLRIQAAASRSGRHADGLVFDVTNRAQRFEGRVTCLRVDGARATIGAVGGYDPDTTDDRVPPVPATDLITVVDDPAGDEVRRVARAEGTAPPDCRAGTFTGPALPLEGSATVHDA